MQRNKLFVNPMYVYDIREEHFNVPVKDDNCSFANRVRQAVEEPLILQRRVKTDATTDKMESDHGVESSKSFRR